MLLSFIIMRFGFFICMSLQHTWFDYIWNHCLIDVLFWKKKNLEKSYMLWTFSIKFHFTKKFALVCWIKAEKSTVYLLELGVFNTAKLISSFFFAAKLRINKTVSNSSKKAKKPIFLNKQRSKHIPWNQMDEINEIKILFT